MPLGSIVIDLLMRTGSFETDTKRAEKRLQELRKEAEKVGAAVGLAFAGYATAAALMVKSSIDAADHLSDLAQQTGLAVESLSALTYAADFGGVSQQTLSDSIVRLTKNMSDAAQGAGEAVDAFNAMGVSVSDSDGSLRDAGDVLLDVAEKFSKYRDGAEKTALAVALFGRSGAQLIPFLNMGAKGISQLTEEAERFGLVLSTETANAAGDFNDTMSRISAIVGGLTNKVAEQLLPTMQNLSGQMLETAEGTEALGDAAEIASAGIKLLTSGGLLVAGVFKTVGDVIGGTAAQISQIFSGEFSEAINTTKNVYADIYENVKEIGDSVSAIWDEPASRIQQKSERIGDGISAPVVKGKDKAVAAARKMANDVEKAIAAINRSVVTFGMDDDEIKLFDLRMSGATPEQLQRAREGMDIVRELNRLQDVSEGRAREREQAEKDLAAVYEETRTPLERYNAELIRLSDLRDKGLDWETYARGVEKAQKAYEDAATSLDLFSRHAAENIQDAIGDGLVDALEGNFDEIASNFARMLARLAAEAAAANIARSLFGGLVSGGQGSGLLGDVLGSVGNFFGFGGGRAGGGDVMPKTAYLVGESGPEMFVPRTMGRILNADDMSRGVSAADGSQTINIQTEINLTGSGQQVNTTADSRSQQARQLGEMISQAVRAEVANQTRQGGIIWNIRNGRG